MSLIAVAVYDTEENKRAELTEKTIESIISTVDFSKHRLIIIDNASCQKTKDLLKYFNTITLEDNIGTAEAINIAWRERKKGENCIKMDNDVVIKVKGWVDEMDEAIAMDPSLGQVGLKRKDCWEYPEHENAEWRSQLLMLPHKPGERWIVAEQCKHIIGTCVMHSSALLDKVGYLYQPGLYGYDDVLMSWRSHLAGFKNVFLPHIEIDHIDPGDTPYQGWKEKHSGQYSKLVSDIVDEYISGKRTLYYEPQGERV